MTAVLLCADDYGLNDAVDGAILELGRAGRLSAASCLTTCDRWPRTAGALPGGLLCGLHVNLSEGEPASTALRRRWPRFPTLSGMILRAHARQLPLPEIACEIEEQLRRFEAARGRAPQFIDGHQHVHHLPGVREIVLDVAAALHLPVRNTGAVPGTGFALKRWLLRATGGRALAGAMAARRIAHNDALLGVYDFAAADYRGLVRGWLRSARPGALLVCHPARGGAGGAADPIAAARQREWAYLRSPDFARDLAEAGCSVATAWTQTTSAG